MLRPSVLLLTLFLGLQARAATGAFDFLPAARGPEKEFQSLMNAGNYREALMAWATTHGQSSFGDSTNGTATFAYLLQQNGLPFSAQQLLLDSTQPSRLHPQLLKLWSETLKGSTFVQKGWINSTGGWKTIVNNDAVTLPIKSAKDVAAAFRRAQQLPADQINAKARVLWQIATQAPQFNDIASALQALKWLKSSGQTAIGADLISLTSARVLYQKGDLTGAQEAFKEIPKGSTLWLEAVEERAWTQLRQEDYDKALGTVTTLLSPALAPLEGPEPYFLANLMNLRVCDYVRLFKTSDLFKTRHRARLGFLQDLASTGSNANLTTLLEKFEKNGVTIEAAGPQIEAIPRSALRDAKFVRAMETRHLLLTESQRANDFKAHAATLGGDRLLDKVIAASQSTADRARQSAIQRLRALAQVEVKEYQIILNKLHIVEAEAIERLHLDDNLKGQRSKLSKTEDKGDKLIFPYNSNEVWFDELDNYQARVKDCPTLKGASL